MYRDVYATRVEALLMRGWTGEAVRAAQGLYDEYRQLGGVYDWRPTELYTRALRAAGQADEALRIMQTVQYVQTDPFVRKRWRLLSAPNLVEREPEKALALCHEYFADLLQASYIPEESVGMAVAYLYLLEKKEGEIRTELLDDATRKLLSEMHPDALNYTATPTELYREFGKRLFERLSCDSEKPFEGIALRLCSFKPGLLMNGTAKRLSPREAELLFVLREKQEGMTQETLHAILYPKNDAKPTAVRQLLFKLRNKGVGIDEQLRLTGPVRADSDELGTAYKPVLPFSQIPFIVQRRDEREEAFRQQLLVSGDAAWVVGQLESFPEDIELHERAVQLLASGEPRRAALAKRLDVLQGA